MDRNEILLLAIGWGALVCMLATVAVAYYLGARQPERRKNPS